MNLINKKDIFCPLCKNLLTQDKEVINNKTTKPMSNILGSCSKCKKQYHWIAYINRNNKFQIAGFAQHLRCRD